jgi:hypothetical protein
LQYSNGELRFYTFFAIFLGILIYSLTISKACVIIINVILETLKIPYYFVKKILIKLQNKYFKESNKKSKKINKNKGI